MTYKCYGEYREAAKAHGERNDCSVRLVSIVCGVSYEEALKACESNGRKKRRGMWNEEIINTVESFGFEVIKEKFPGKTAVTLERDLRKYARGRKFFIEMRGHVAAFDGENIVDWAQGRRKRILNVWRVKKISTVERETVTGQIKNQVLPSIEIVYAAPWLRDLPKPKGAPKIGECVKVTRPDETTYTAEVTEYLSSQFIVKMASGFYTVVSISDDWQVER